MIYDQFGRPVRAGGFDFKSSLATLARLNRETLEVMKSSYPEPSTLYDPRGNLVSVAPRKTVTIRRPGRFIDEHIPVRPPE